MVKYICNSCQKLVEEKKVIINLSGLILLPGESYGGAVAYCEDCYKRKYK